MGPEIFQTSMAGCVSGSLNVYLNLFTKYGNLKTWENVLVVKVSYFFEAFLFKVSYLVSSVGNGKKKN